MRFNHVKTKNIIYFPYKKFRTKSLRFNQNRPYIDCISTKFFNYIIFIKIIKDCELF
jgi:hypothetical protein